MVRPWQIFDLLLRRQYLGRGLIIVSLAMAQLHIIMHTVFGHAKEAEIFNGGAWHAVYSGE